MNLSYFFVESKDELNACLDDLTDGARKMVGRTGGHGTSAELIISMMMKTVETKNHFLLMAYDEKNVFQGFCYALLVDSRPAWVDIVGIYTKANVGMAAKGEVFEFLKAWAHKRNAKKILAGITRSPAIFYQHFHKPLGFKPIGIIVEYDLTEGQTDA